MSNATRHTLGNLLSVLVVLAAGLFVVALATRGLVHSPGDAPAPMAGVTTVAVSQAAAAPPAIPGVPAAPAANPTTPVKTGIRLVIDYGDGVQKHFTSLEHKAGLTAMDALLAAKAHPRGIKVEFTGKGETAFISSIDDLKNQGTGKDKKNWQFFVNDVFATQGPGATPLKAGDTVRWVFDKWLGK